MDSNMHPQIRQWKLAIERFYATPDPDYREMARMVAEIAATDLDETLRQAAAQVLPILRRAALTSADRRTRMMALRRLGIIGDALHMLAMPLFGRRGLAPKAPTQEDQYRQLLGLPLGRRLATTEIHQAFKHAAKTAHPDGGGNGPAFHELAAARDALIRHH
ncbi:hypothetical protein [Bradyrhizobium sp. LTSPM299]|uniref:hypothetical protein n=1 Tax=Bradyrhizobium sp. LTSPM299 TaxID=1619233 RepID=UPI000ACB2C2D|nr:hypothetical protein [Bradyrhizobium sp. LTSPM299]